MIKFSKWIFLGFLLMLPIMSAQAYQYVSAQRFLTMCKQPAKMNVCRAYISGVIDDTFSYYSFNNHHDLRVFAKNMRSWDAEKLRVSLLKWVVQNPKMANDKNAANMINQFLYSMYIKPSVSPCA